MTVSDGTLMGRVFRTDTSGRFVLQPARDDMFSIRFHLPGYEDASYRVAEAPDVDNIDIELRPEAGHFLCTTRANCS